MFRSPALRKSGRQFVVVERPDLRNGAQIPPAKSHEVGCVVRELVSILLPDEAYCIAYPELGEATLILARPCSPISRLDPPNQEQAPLPKPHLTFHLEDAASFCNRLIVTERLNPTIFSPAQISFDLLVISIKMQSAAERSRAQ